MGNNPIAVRVYAVRDPEKILGDIARAQNTQTWGVGKRNVYSESKYSTRIFYYPISPKNKSAGILIGVVGDPDFIHLEAEAQEKRYGEGAIIDITKQLGRKMDDIFLRLNRSAREQEQRRNR